MFLETALQLKHTPILSGRNWLSMKYEMIDVIDSSK